MVKKSIKTRVHSTRDKRKTVQNYLFITGLVFGLLLSITAVQAQTILTVKDTLTDHGTSLEHIQITTLNTQEDITLPIPAGAEQVTVNDVTTTVQDNKLDLSICSGCTSTITYTLLDTTHRAEGQRGEKLFQKSLTYDFAIDQLSFQLILPPGTFIAQTSEVATIAPTPDTIRTDGQHIILEWSSSTPEFPLNYIASYASEESPESELSIDEVTGELDEWPVWILIFISLAIGLGIGILLRNTKKYRDTDLPYIPLTLLSPDEQTILEQIEKNKGHIGQKELGQQLEWSKSKVSALMTALEHKRIISRRKHGRNYTITIIKEIEKVK